MKKTIDLNKHKESLFNNLIYKLQKSVTRWVISYGGAGSGKSYTQAQHEIIQALKKKQKTLIVRKYSTTLKDSCISLVKEILSDWGIYYQENKSEKTITFDNGSTMLFKGMDDQEKIKSITGIRRIWIEEASELDEEDVDQLNLRLRGMSELQITMTFNPISEDHWIKRRFFDENPQDVTTIHTTYLDNKFLDKEYKRVLQGYKDIDYKYYQVYALGEWGQIRTGGEFYKAFEPMRNVDNVQYDPKLPLHISFDENVHPYLPATIWQGQGNTVWCIDEVTMEAPMNGLENICTEIKKRYHSHNSGVYIYGDATAKKEDVKIEKGYNFYRLIEKYLKEFHPVTRVHKSNPNVMMRGLFINSVFAAKLPVNIMIGGNCKRTIEDLQSVKEAADGTKEKKKITDPKTGIRYEPYGHLSDSLDYFVTWYFENEYNKFQNKGDSSQAFTFNIGQTQY
jgi:hypothetical protein